MYHLIILYNMYYTKSIYTVSIILARLLHTYSSCTAVTVGVLKTIAIVTIIATIITIAIVITVASVVNVGTEVLKRRKRRCGGTGSVALPLKKVYKPPALSQKTFAAYYLIPNIVIRKTKPIGHYGRLRKAYLEMHRPILFNELVLSDKLFEHCAEIDEAARNRMELIVRSLAEQNGVTEQLKADNQMEWVRQMNACKAQAEEVVKAELIYD